MNNLIIGIAGGSGSGKTTLALRLKERFGEDEVRLISHDSYYKRHDELPFEERCKLNYDHPDAFDNALLIYHLQELKAGRAIDCPVYDYSNHNRSDKVQHIEPAPVLIVEGILPHPALCGAGAVRPVRLQDLCGHRRRRAHPAPSGAGCEGAGPQSGQRHQLVPDHRQAHARGLCGTQQAQRRHHCTQRRREHRCGGDAGPSHP